MPKVVLYTLTSLDGAVDDPRRYFPGSGTEPGAPVFDQELADLEAELIAGQEAVLLGRGTYDEWSRYWPTSAEQPFADFINGVQKYVVTSAPLIGHWANTRAVPGPVSSVLADLRARATGDIGVHASIRLAQSLLAEGLVDELCLAVGPVVDPVGRRLFEGATNRQQLRLLDSRATPSGSLWLRYRLS